MMLTVCVNRFVFVCAVFVWTKSSPVKCTSIVHAVTVVALLFSQVSSGPKICEVCEGVGVGGGGGGDTMIGARKAHLANMHTQFYITTSN